jgi:hypothetical protein
VGLLFAVILLFGITWLGSGGMLFLAIGLYVSHARRSRLAGFALRPAAKPEEGPALLGGVVESGTDDEPGPAPPAGWRSKRAPPFTLVLQSGARVRIEPDEGRWSLAATFGPDRRHDEDADTVPAPDVHAGDTLYVRGPLRREMTPGVPGKGYREASTGWVMRGDLTFCSPAVIAAHARLAAIHRSWALRFAALFAIVHLVLPLLAGSPWGAFVAALLVMGAGVAYRNTVRRPLWASPATRPVLSAAQHAARRPTRR